MQPPMQVGARRASELESFLKEQPENWQLIGDLALVNAGLGDKAAALGSGRNGPWPRLPAEKDAVDWGSIPIEFLARVAARLANPTAPSPLCRDYSRYRARLRLRCSGSIRCSIRSGMIRVSKNSPSCPHRNDFQLRITRIEANKLLVR